MAIGYFDDLEEAQDYFINQRLERFAWEDLDDDEKQSAAIVNAYNRLYYGGETKNMPTKASASAAQLVKLKIANAEMAYYMAEHLKGEDSRKGLQAQGVIEAGIVEEKYDKDSLFKLPIPPFVKGILISLGLWAKLAFAAVDLTRNEDEPV